MSEPFKFGPSARAQLLIMGVYSAKWAELEHAVQLDLDQAAAFKKFAAASAPSPRAMLKKVEKMLRKKG